MADSRDITGKNRKFKGTSGIVLPKGTQAQRADTESGELRFNTDSNLAEYYDGTSWKPIDSPPAISGISPTTFASDGVTLTQITITGTSFSSSVTVDYIGADGTVYSATGVTRVSSTTITANTVATMDVGNEPYDVKVTNSSGLAATLEDALDAGSTPTFSTASGNIGSVASGGTDFSGLSTLAATDADGSTVTHTVTSGSLPSGVSMATNATLSGTAPSVASSTDYTFTVSATDGINIATRVFVLTITPPPYMSATGGTVTTDGDFKVHTFTSGGTFTVSSVGADATYGNKVEYLVVAGGGGAGQNHGGGGGAGGYRHNSAYNFTVSATGYPISVGSGGGAGGGGGTSTFSSITSSGGGRGGQDGPGASGGSGGGGGSHPGSYGGGSGNSPPVSPPQGNSGGSGSPANNYQAGGGGGAGGAGQSVPSGVGGPSATNDISGSTVHYSAGGGGHSHGGSGKGGPVGGGNMNGAGHNGGSATYGSGSGGNGHGSTNNSVPGIVVIRYKFQ